MTKCVAMLAVLAAFVAVGCGGGNKSDDGGGGGGGSTATTAEKGPIVVGGALGLTGIYQPYDVPGLNAIKLVFDRVNADGGIDGRQIKVITGDTKSEIPQGASVAKDLIRRGAQILLVSCDFDFGSPAATVAQQAGKIVFSVCAQSPKFGVQGIGDKAYTVSLSVNAEGAVLANFAAKKGFRKPFLMLDTTIAYDQGLCDGFKKGFAARGGTIAGEATFKNSDSSISTQITQLKNSGADSVVMCTYQPGGASALRQIRAAGVDLPILAGGSFDGTFWVRGIPDISNFYVSAQKSVFGNDPDPKVNDFVKLYKQTYGAAPALSYNVVSYSVGEALVKALQETNGSTDGNALRDVLDRFDKEPLLVGPTTFTSDVHIPLDRPMTILQYTNGQPKPIDNLGPATQVGIGG